MKIIPLFITLISLSTFADSFDFKCTGSDLVYVNSFSMQGSIDTEDGTITYDVETRKAGNNGAISTTEDVTRDAKFQDLRDVNTQDSLGLRAYSADTTQEHVYVNILMNYAGKLASVIRDDQGFEYRSDCKSL